MQSSFGTNSSPQQSSTRAGTCSFSMAIGAVSTLLLTLLLLQTTPAVSQNTNATIRGEVFDPSGAVVPKAQVLIANQDTGVTVYNGATDSAGTFVAPEVAPGTYRVVVSFVGFKQSVVRDLIASVAQITSVNVILQLGDIAETVTVESKGEQLDATTSDVSTLIAPSDVQNLPLEQRTTENLLAFIPGVTHGGAANEVNTSQLSINGSRTLDNEVLLNGVSLVAGSTGILLPLPSPDGIDSFRVRTTNAPAEYGRTSGAVISISSKSGTNTYHGNLYFLLRNEALDANEFFNKDTISSTTGAITPRNRDRFFQMGGSLGGPVRIPHLYNGHDKTFFFANYDRTILPSSQVISETVPTTDQRSGNLSSALATTDANGKARTPQQIYMANGKSSAPFMGDQIGPIDPAAAKILALLPSPNTVGTYDPVNNRYTSNWTAQQNLTSHVLRLNGRIDEALTQTDRVSFSVYRYTTSSPQPVYYNSPLLDTTWDCTCNNAWVGSVDYTRIWSSTLVTDLNMGFFRYQVLRNPPGRVGNVSQTTGIASLPINQMPQITDPGFSNIGSDATTDQVNTTNTFVPFGTITKTFGPHTFKFGGSIRKNQFNSFNPKSAPEGSLTFDGSITNHGSTGNANTGIADFLLGTIKTANYEQPQPPTGRRNYNWGIFAQDDWQAIPRLTLNLGIRYEYEAPIVIASNIYSRIDPANGQLLAAGINSVSRSLNLSTPKADVSPRIGIAFSIDSKTVVRAAFGTFYGTIFQNLGSGPAYPGFDNTISYNNLGTAIAQPFSLSQGLPLAAPANLQNPFAALTGSSASSPYSVAALFSNLHHMSMMEQWNLGIQRQLPFAITLEVNYVGNHGLHLPFTLNQNAVPLASVPAVTLANTSLATQNALQFPNLTSFSTTDNIGGSNYNSLQVTVRRNFNTRLAILSNYAFSKSMDDGTFTQSFSSPTSSSAFAQYPVNSSLRIKDIATGSLDVKHILNIAVVYTTGGPWWLRGFHISPVFVGSTGIPLNISQTSEIPSSSQRPNGNPRLLKLAHPLVTGSSLQYFDSPQTDSNFPLTPSGPVYNTISGVRTQIVPTGFGNVSRNSNRAPGQVSFDASVAKDFHLYKRLGFQFRIDAFNVINHTNFGLPSTSLTVSENGTTASFATSSSFGKITRTNPNREMQASARFFF
jgi:Carboxypeptidase regulatory-like domain/TonB-dependent Receptor Plug Domain